MRLSAKARYAVLALVDLAMHGKKIEGTSVPISLMDIANRQNLSQQYLEQLFGKLRKDNIVKSVRGQNGGYYLSIPQKDLSISMIIRSVDETIKSTQCNPDSKQGCQGKESKCPSHHLWNGMETTINTYLSSITLEDVVNQSPLPVAVMTYQLEKEEVA